MRSVRMRRARALSVEVRNGRLCVFMPPVETLADYLELLAVIGRSKVDREQFLIDLSDRRVATLAVCPQPPVHQPLAERVSGFRHLRKLYASALSDLVLFRSPGSTAKCDGYGIFLVDRVAKRWLAINIVRWALNPHCQMVRHRGRIKLGYPMQRQQG